MKVLLIEPPPIKERVLRILGSFGKTKADYIWPPLDLMIISGMLKRYDIESKILDANALNLSLNKVKEEIKKYDPDKVVFTTSTSTIINDIKIARITKEVSKEIETVAIGTHAFVTHEELIKNKTLDFVSEYPESESWLLRLLTGQNRIKNLEDFGFPAHDELDLKLYRDPLQKRHPFTITFGSRGCWWSKCIYCSCPAFFEPLRKRKIENIIKELKWIVKLGIKEIKWFDAELNCDIDWLNKLCEEMIKNKIDLTWSGNARVDNLPAETLKLMKRAGCHTLHIGVESGDQKILDNIKKGITIEQVKEAVKNIKEVKLNVVTYFMLGLPGETLETMKKTLNLAKGLDPDATTFSVATPHPGTIFYDWLEKNKMFITKNYNNFDPSLPPVFNLKNLTSTEIYEFMRYSYRNFYFRPRYILRKLLKTRRLVEIKNGILNFLLLLRRYG